MNASDYKLLIAFRERSLKEDDTFTAIPLKVELLRTFPHSL